MTLRSVFSSLHAAHTAPAALLKRLTPLRGVDLRVVTLFLARFSPRERRFIAAAGVVCSGMVVYWLLVDPLWEAHTRLRARVAAKERELSEVVTLRRDYLALHAEAERARQATTDTNFSPVAFLEDLASNTVGRDKVAAINPAGRDTRTGTDQETIELKLSGVSLRELVEVLYKIDTAAPVLYTTDLAIKKRYKDPYTFDVTLTTLALSAR